MSTHDMTLQDWLNTLEQQHPVTVDLGLDRLRVVAERLGLLEQPLARRVITVAGTNGKGSTVTMIEAIACASGLTCGSYMSPHLRRYNERVKLQGQPVDDAHFIRAFERIDAVRQAPGLPVISLSYFEVGTLAAALIFQEAALDVVVLEVGLGGRLDAVNLFDADVGVVTTIGIDHVGFLGDDLASIGREKAGILRAGKAAVLGSAELPESVRAVAEQCPVASCRQLGTEFSRSDRNAANGHWCWHGLDRAGKAIDFDDLPDPGLPLDNAATAIQACCLAFETLDIEQVRHALMTVQLPGRLQWIGQWCLDVAHNPHAAHYVAHYFERRDRQASSPVRRLALLGMLGDKDADGVIAALSPVIDGWVVTSLTGERAREALTLSDIILAQGGHVDAVLDDVASAVHWCQQASQYDEILVCGSFHTVSEALDVLMPL